MGGKTRKTITHRLPSGREITIAELSYADWENCREQAMVEYRDTAIKTWARNLRHMPGWSDAQREAKLLEKIDEIARMTEADIPKKAMEVEVKVGGKMVKRTQEVPYTATWLNSTEGQMHAIWLAMRGGGEDVTKDDVVSLLMQEGDVDVVSTKLSGINRSEYMEEENPTAAVPE